MGWWCSERRLHLKERTALCGPRSTIPRNVTNAGLLAPTCAVSWDKCLCLTSFRWCILCFDHFRHF